MSDITIAKDKSNTPKDMTDNFHLKSKKNQACKHYRKMKNCNIGKEVFSDKKDMISCL